MSKYCSRYMDDAPGIRADCAAFLSYGGDCEHCSRRDIHAEVKDLRAERDEANRICEQWRQWTVATRAENVALRAEVERLTERVNELQRWKDEVIDCAVISWVYKKEHEDSGCLCVTDIIAQVIREERDPALGGIAVLSPGTVPK